MNKTIIALMNNTLVAFKTLVALMIAVCAIPYLYGASQQDLTKPIHQFIDGFNKGDMNSTYAAYVSGNVFIVDEFAPHLWHGPHAAQDWATDFDKMTKAEGSSDAKAKYGAPTRTEVESDAAYVILPVVIDFKQHGQAMTEKGEMTFVLHQEKGAWKIASWTWTGEAAHAVK